MRIVLSREHRQQSHPDFDKTLQHGVKTTQFFFPAELPDFGIQRPPKFALFFFANISEIVTDIKTFS